MHLITPIKFVLHRWMNIVKRYHRHLAKNRENSHWLSTIFLTNAPTLKYTHTRATTNFSTHFFPYSSEYINPPIGLQCSLRSDASSAVVCSISYLTCRNKYLWTAQKNIFVYLEVFVKFKAYLVSSSVFNEYLLRNIP